jgi:hypothetical protein
VTVSISGQTVIEDYEVFYETARLYLPLVDKDSQCAIYIRQFDDLPEVYTFVLRPVKKWTIQFLASSHEDLGYCEYVNRLGSSCADYLDLAMEIMDHDARYKYLIEHDWWLKNFAAYGDAQSQARLRHYFASGNIELNAPPCSVHTHWHGAEQLARSLYFSCKEDKAKWGVSPQTALYADLSGASWSAVSAYRQAGVRYLAILFNPGFRMSADNAPLPKLFWWVGPNGKDRLLCWRQKGYREALLHYIICDTLRQYPEGEFYFDESKARKTESAIQLLAEELGDVSYDLLPIGFYDDREKPTTMLLTVCDKLNERWAWPRFQLGLPGQFMKYLEENFGDTLPSYAGDLTDQWADFATIAPRWFAEKRAAQVLLPTSELLTTLSAIDGGEKLYPKAEINDAFWRLCEFDDHCWATSSKHPQAMHRFNLYAVKRETAKVAKRTADRLITDAIGKSDDGALAVWNPVPVRRKTALRLPEGLQLEGVACQKTENGETLTEPVELPACGYRVFQKTRQQPSGSASQLTEGSFATPFYRVACNLKTQQLVSIVDKASGEELLDSSARYGLGDFIYVNTDGKTDRQLHFEVAKRRDFQIRKGKLATVVTRTAYEEQSGANVSCTVAFYDREKNIDVRLQFENASGLMGDYYDRYRKNIFFAFPFRLDDHHFCTELAAGVADERRDRLPVNPRDFVVAHNWVAVENSKRGIALLSKDMPVFHLGGIHYNQLSSKVCYNTPQIYLYAASNRCNQLNFASKEDCSGSYRLSILPYLGGWQDSVPGWSTEKMNPPLFGAAGTKRGAKSYLSVDCDHVRLLCFKRAEDREDLFVARFVETSGKQALVNLTLPFQVKEAKYANLLEEDLGSLARSRENNIQFEIQPFSFVTLLLAQEALSLADGQADEKEICNLFTFVSENDKTIVCFEKKADFRDIKAFEVYGDGKLLLTVGNDPYKVQFCTVPGAREREYSVKAI